MPGAVDEPSCTDLGDDGYGLNAQRVGVDFGLAKALFVVFHPEEEHALEGEGFEHSGDDGVSSEDIAVSHVSV